MEKHANSKEVFRLLLSGITIAESKGEIESIAYLVLHSLFGMRREHVMAGKELTYDDAELTDIISRINKNEPIQYILQEAEFFGRLFFVDKNVLIPRPETEILIREVLKYNGKRILDIGTGSGCIAVTLGCELPLASIFATDLSPHAIEVAHKNSLTFNTYVDFYVNDILNDELPVSDIDVIVSNPPYVAQSESASMRPNVIDYEPHLALFVPDNDPLIFYKAIASKAQKVGAVFVEINEGFGAEVKSIFNDHGFTAEIIHDLDKKPRIIKAIR